MAINLPVYQSSVYATQSGVYGPRYAADGNRQTNLRLYGCSHSRLETNPWWAVELSVPLTVTGVLFTNRDSSGRLRANERTVSESHFGHI